MSMANIILYDVFVPDINMLPYYKVTRMASDVHVSQD